jgi:adenylate kinase
MKTNIVLMGPPGAGKGTLAKKLASAYKLPHISTGDMFREAIGNKTKVGLEAKVFIDAGHLVPDDVTIALVKERLSQKDCAKGYIFDGFPRTLLQAEALTALTKELKRPIQIVININEDKAVLVDRISGRRVCKVCGAPFHVTSMKPKKDGICDACGGELIQRKDDNAASLLVRLDHYEKDTFPINEYYKGLKLLVEFSHIADANDLFAKVGICLAK